MLFHRCFFYLMNFVFCLIVTINVSTFNQVVQVPIDPDVKSEKSYSSDNVNLSMKRWAAGGSVIASSIAYLLLRRQLQRSLRWDRDIQKAAIVQTVEDFVDNDLDQYLVFKKKSLTINDEIHYACERGEVALQQSLQQLKGQIGGAKLKHLLTIAKDEEWIDGGAYLDYEKINKNTEFILMYKKDIDKKKIELFRKNKEFVKLFFRKSLEEESYHKWDNIKKTLSFIPEKIKFAPGGNNPGDCSILTSCGYYNYINGLETYDDKYQDILYLTLY
ncbi:MAG: hypothetical protein WBQ73_02075, partial [Candidatus Babeliales bacterium]